MTPVDPHHPTPVGLTKDAGWEIGVSKTIDADVDSVWRFLTAPEGMDLWIGRGARLGNERRDPYETDDGTRGELRSRRERDRIRITWQPAAWSNASTVQVAITGRGDRTTIRFHQERLASADQRVVMRDRWRTILGRIADELAPAAED